MFKIPPFFSAMEDLLNGHQSQFKTSMHMIPNEKETDPFKTTVDEN